MIVKKIGWCENPIQHLSKESNMSYHRATCSVVLLMWVSIVLYYLLSFEFGKIWRNVQIIFKIGKILTSQPNILPKKK
jgi:hypothetical protein